MANEAFQIAVAHHRAGRLREAEVAYREILEGKPRDVDALHMLGVLASQVGRNDIAAEILQQALSMMPGSGVMHAELGEFQRRLGRLEEAEESCRRAVALEPMLAEGHFNLGAVLQEERKLEAAIGSYRAALAINPANAAALYNLGNALRDCGRLDDAIGAYRAALAINSGYAEAEGNLGLALHKMEDLSGAIACFKRVLARRPKDLVALSSLGNVLRDSGDRDGAASCFRRALELKPDDAAAHINFGKLLHDEGNFQEAADHYRKAIAASPERAEAYQNLGMVWEKLGRRDEAVAMYRESLLRGVDSPVARFNMAALTAFEVPAQAPPGHVIESCDALAETFDERLVDKLKYRGHLQVHGAAMAAAGGASLGSVMDLGCGTGLCGTLFRPHCKRLSGVDLSPRMIDKARTRNIYDELLLGEIIEVLAGVTRKFDAVIAGDVLVYFGELDGLFAAVGAALADGGIFVLTAEALEGGGRHELMASRRYAPSADYLRATAVKQGFVEVSLERTVLRQERGKDVAGLVMVLRRV